MKSELAVDVTVPNPIWQHQAGRLISNFESGTINHSATSPCFKYYPKTSLYEKIADKTV